MLIINVDKLDFQHNPEDLGKIVDAVQAELNGLFTAI